ncbi:chemotaxis protein CheA [Conexibacter woesei]|uniref:Chemotaxis protein CheA n=1 Tax=Conexibacter woesei (strain DSM 14684 / CCUG 47730 / CIP 108061 / JCM 11494 / NBRC 100937 / ID131577) TaxID=469383 RepID=D3F412_CONWI|nr:chemotaxis protein CheA [Conexibacter woesei]ADB48495.1 CheA signal transduction histidine kinase [Conexibacter woesei DSM 14684]
MDTSEYLPMFLAESREHLQELNLAVVRIEETPDDRDTVDEIFRIAHSLKGMSATMGFAAIAALTHQMEDVFELLRQRADGLPREAVDVLFKCLDALEAAVEEIATDGAEQLDPAALIEQLKGLIRERTPEQELDKIGGVDLPDLPTVRELADGSRVVHVAADLSDEALMPAVRAFMFFQALAELGELVGSIPAQDGVEQFQGTRLEAWLASDREDHVIEAAAAGVSDVEHVAVQEAQDDLMPPSIETLSAAHADAEPALVGGPAVDHAAPARRVATNHAAGGAHAGATVRVDAERLDQLMHFMGELVIHRTVVETLAGDADVPGLQQAIQDMARSSQALQAMVMQVRMIPVEAVFLRFPRLVRDLSSKLSKEVELQLVGQETELDRTVVDALGDPLVHLVRNALDHGLEPPDEREAAGKPRTGVLEISARHAGGNVVISVRDDGRGVDPAKVAQKAFERGLISEEAIPAVDSQRAAELLFTAGFSTAESTSDISGRGVGMDAVQAKIRELGGEVIVDSEFGVGMTASIRLPLTLAIMSALLVEAEGMPFAVPLDRVERTLRLEDHAVRSVAGQRMLVLRDGVLPLIDAGEALAGRVVPSGEAHDHAVIVRGRDRRLALAVGTLVGQRELVTRPLPPEVSDRAAVSGGAVLSNGEISLIVDCDALTARATEPVPVS